MAETNIGSASASDLTTAITDYSVDSASIDGATGTETTYIQTKYETYLGYYKNIPELAAAIDAKATWTVGKGFTADEVTSMMLGTIKGWGKDTFNTILENLIRTYHIAGDAYAEIIRDDDDVLINLKVLNPGSIQIVADPQGNILRYEQISKTKKGHITIKKENMLHFARNRMADEIHGGSIIPALENIILMRNEAMSDWKRVLHRNIEPMFFFHLDTDDTAKIAAFKAKMDAAKGSGENMYIPKGAVVPELVATAANATLNPITWIDQLNQYFFQATGVPDIIIGASKNLTEASSKIAYLAFQQTIEEEQLFIEEQILAQLNLVIELEFPASLENELLSDNMKDGQGEQAAQPNDMTAEMEGQ